jgi:signal transduction histidine kinase
VDLHDDGTTVALTVADDGVGFRPAAPRALLRAGHFGLVGMRERLESAHGLLVVESALGEGTRLTARVPRGAATAAGAGGDPAELVMVGGPA